jgi:adenylate kinase
MLSMLCRPPVRGVFFCCSAPKRYLSTTLERTSGKIRAIIIGAPGCGKGTISNWIVRDFKMEHVSSGDLLRAHINNGTPLGKEAKFFIDKGNLVPDATMVGLMSSSLKEKGDVNWYAAAAQTTSGREVLIVTFSTLFFRLLDGFPRTLEQAAQLQAETPVNVVIHVDVPFQTIVDRVKDRLVHPGSGRIYNTLFSPPKVEGKDDVTGEPLIQREDDKPGNVGPSTRTLSHPSLCLIPHPICMHFENRRNRTSTRTHDFASNSLSDRTHHQEFHGIVKLNMRIFQTP